ncbi:MAG: hypothetical protein K9H64_13725 [Bacteroidales bacterium]|nr:hypothetical protein [Bacteroidales bacterium]MCF8457073.1 hypothetical protein [Bacteroidales bacterium]
MIPANRILKILISLLILLQLVAFQSSTSPEKWIPFPENEKFKAEWKKVDELEKKGLPKSALEIVDQIYASAKKSHNAEQVAKALIYRSKFISQTEEDAFPKIIGQVLDEIAVSKFPLKQILHSYAASYYWGYYSKDQWRISQRTVIPGFQSEDITDWDKMDFLNKMNEHLEASLQNADSLQRVQISNFEDIINEGTQPKELRPSLYDFLAHRAIQYYESSNGVNTLLSDDQFLADEKFFAPAKEFAKLKIIPLDSSSNHFKILGQYQAILRNRLKQENIPALVDADLARLDYVNDNSTADAKDSLYLDALKSLHIKYAEDASVAEVMYREGKYYESKAQWYDWNDPAKLKFKDYAKTAERLFVQVVERFGESHAAGMSRYELEVMRKKELTMRLESGVIPGRTFPCQAEYKNLSEVFLQVYKVDTIDYFKQIVKDNGRDLVKKLIGKSELVREQKLELPGSVDLNKHSAEFLVEGLPIGKYIFMLADNDKFNLGHGLYAWDFLNVSNIAYMNRGDRSKGATDILVVDRDNGAPVPGISIDKLDIIYSRGIQSNEIRKTATLKTNKEGFVTLPGGDGYNRSNSILFFKHGKDFLISDENFYNPGKSSESNPKVCSFFLDRMIYRPGQIVYFKGIVHSGKGNESKVIENQKVQIQLIDANWQTLKEQDYVSNEFGSFSGSFTLPKSALTGNFRIQTKLGSIDFRVEEYKRPKMQVTFSPIEGQYRFNDEVTVKGTVKSYTGQPVSFADIQYTVTRSNFGDYRFYMPWKPSLQIDFGKVETNEKGEFTLSFKAICPKVTERNTSFNFDVSVDATDQNGETQSASTNVSIQDKAIFIESDFPRKVDLSTSSEEEFMLAVKTVNQQKIDNVVDLEVFQLEAPALLFSNKLNLAEKNLQPKEEWQKLYPGHEYRDELHPDNYPVKKQVAKFSIDTKDQKSLKFDQLGKRAPGVYKICFSTKDKFGRTVEKTIYSEFFDSHSEKLHAPKTDWFVALKKKAEPGEKAQFLIGTGLEKVQVLYEIILQGNIVKQEWMTLKEGQKLIEVPVEEKHRGGFQVSFTFAQNNHVFLYTEQVDVPFSNKELDISFETFRDQLYPGQKEEWRVKIRGPKGDKVAAELLCGMYDASLDKFAPNPCSSFFEAPYYFFDPFMTSTFSSGRSQLIYEDYQYPRRPNDLYYDQLLWFGFGGYYMDEVAVRSSRQSLGMFNGRGEKGIVDADNMIEIKGESFQLNNVETNDGAYKFKNIPEEGDYSVSDVSDGYLLNKFISSDIDLTNVYTRSNFNETAFFYPQLQTNEMGDVVIAFTVPESLTRWNINGLAHTKDVSTGLFHKELVTKKELMAEANPPRFFREGDRIVFPVKISNMSDTLLQGQVKLEFVNALNNETIKLSKEAEQLSFSIAKNGNQTITWELTIPENVYAISYTVKASTGTFLDGETKILPVLSNRMLVTESLPMSVRKAGKTSFEFKKLKENKSTTLKNHKLTLEFTQNPAWYAVQALPYLMEFPHECAEQLFSRYYANTLAGHIVNSMPEIKRVFEQWKISDNKETFLSNLEKNQDLKNIILNETPWVRDALNENQQKENIALLFDLNKMKDELNMAWQKLQKMQMETGAWPWFPGLRENRYITQHIVAGLGHLKHLGIIDISTNQPQFNAIRQALFYLDKEMYSDYTRYNSNKELNSLLVHYLYMRSFFPDMRLSKIHQEAVDHYFAEAQKNWLKFNKYEQAMIALALQRNGDSESPMAIIKSLKEFSISSDEFGMYWKNGNGYYWNNAPIEQQALMIELFEEVAKDPASVNELKIWLLKQKQTQAWKTTKATADAVYALLLSGDNWLDSKEDVKIQIGNQLIQPSKDKDIALEAGTGYFKKSWEAGEINPSMGNISITKTTDRLSWGAVYWQYFEDLNKITAASAGLSMVKELYIETKSKEKTELIKVTDKNQLKVGDKLIVRIHLKSDRNLEFVHMKDMRASGLEPVNFLSGHHYQGGMYYYESIRDASVNFFFDYLPKGDYVFEYPLWVAHSGDFSNGITTIQCMYAPEFGAHSQGVELKIGE